MGILLRLLVAAGLAADAYVHWTFADEFHSVKTDAPIHPEFLFQAQAVLAAVVGVLVLIVANRLTYAIAFLVAGSAVGALVFYYYVDAGEIWPLPAMYEPVWYTEKTISLVGEGIAAVAALIGFLTVRRSRVGASAHSV